MAFQEGANTATPEELFRAAFEGAYEDEAAWEAVHALRRRGGDEVFRLALKYSKSEEPLRRARALDVLGQLGAGQASGPAHADERTAVAISSLDDASLLVTHSAAWALAHIGGDLAISTLLDLRDHTDPQVRHAVAFGLAGSTRPDAIATLVRLTSDEDDEVRNWATFGLGNAGAEAGPPARLGTMDSPQIRDALRKRLADPFPDARNEAIWGLALRRDPVALRLLLNRLSAEEWIAGDEMAAAETLGADYDTPVESLRAGLQSLLSDT